MVGTGVSRRGSTHSPLPFFAVSVPLPPHTQARKPILVSTCGLFAGALYAFSPLTWTYSTGSEVFVLNNLACAAIIYLVLRCVPALSFSASDSHHNRYLVATAFRAQCANQLITVFLCTTCVTVAENVPPYCACHPPGRYDAETKGQGAAAVQRLLGTLCFVAGLALSNQHTSVLLIGPLGLWVLVVGASRHGWTVGILAKLLLAYVGFLHVPSCSVYVASHDPLHVTMPPHLRL